MAYILERNLLRIWLHKQVSQYKGLGVTIMTNNQHLRPWDFKKKCISQIENVFFYYSKNIFFMTDLFYFGKGE